MEFERFKLIDRVADIDIDKRTIRCETAVPEHSTIFEGHFPGYPLVPGVLLLEMMAQTSGWLTFGVIGFRRMAFLASIKEAKFRSFVGPGARLEFSAQMVHEGSGFVINDAKGFSEGKPVCEASITLRVVDFPKPELKHTMIEVARSLAFPMELVAND
jgi:3-hydroxyacyl-[acyl-carrier-protein] dehydratase